MSIARLGWWTLMTAALALAGACDDGGGDAAAMTDAGGPDVDRDAGQITQDVGADARSPADGAPRDAEAPADGAAGADGGGDAAIGDAAPLPPDGGLGLAAPPRECDITLRLAAPGAAVVLLAGEFTRWGDAPLAMAGPDGDGVFEITLSPDGQQFPGDLYAYKFIVDGEWRLDPEGRYRKYDGDCVNSAFRMPACDAGPEIRPGDVRTTFADGRGTAEVTVELRSAQDAAPIDVVSIALDGEPVGFVPAARFDVRVPDLAPGRHVLRVRANDLAGRDAAPVDLPFWIEERPFEWRDALMYMLVIDRFANGDAAIDDPHGAPVLPPADWHGGDLWGALEVLQSGYFEELGVRAIWLSPVNTQTDGEFRGLDSGGRYLYTGYHGYWAVEGVEVEPRFGGDAALAAFVAEAHRRGIRVLLDLILNQVHEEHVYYRDHPEWFRTGCVCGVDPDCGWSQRPLDCLFAEYLPDINWREPGAEAQFIADAVEWIDRFDVDGFRVDAVKHVETTAVYNLRAALADRFEQGGGRIAMFGETAVGEGDQYDDHCGVVYRDGYAWVDAYVGRTALDGQFDFPSHHRMQAALLEDTLHYDDLEAIVRDLERRYRPEGVHVRFLGTHDSSRIASRAAEDRAQNCRWPEEGACATLPQVPVDAGVYGRIRRAMTVLMTLPGVPLLYYGDEIAMAGGNDPDNRRDMVWTGERAALAMGATEIAAEQAALRGFVAALGRARQGSDALRRGRRTTHVAEPDLYVVGWDTPDEVAILIVNRGGAVAGRALRSELLGGVQAFEVQAGEARVEVDAATLTLNIEAGGAAILTGPRR